MRGLAFRLPPVTIVLLAACVVGIAIAFWGEPIGLVMIAAGCVVVGAYMEFKWRRLLDRWQTPEMITHVGLLLRAGLNALIAAATLLALVGLAWIYVEPSLIVVLTFGIVAMLYLPYSYWLLRRRYDVDRNSGAHVGGPGRALRYVGHYEPDWHARILVGALGGATVAVIVLLI